MVGGTPKTLPIIDDDLGRSASGAMARPGFDRLVAELCAGTVGVLGSLGLGAGATSGEWSVEYQSDVSRIGISALSLSVVWVALMFLYRLTGLRFLRHLETPGPRDE